MTKRQKTIEIVAEHLTAHGFDGLMNSYAGCGCELSKLVPCESDFSQCKPGYKHMDPRPESRGDWAMFPTKDAPSAEQWEQVDA